MNGPRPALVLFRLFAAGYLAVLMAVGYWTLARAHELAHHERNPRYWQTLRQRQRGEIVAGRERLAWSEIDQPAAPGRPATWRRQYVADAPAFAHVLGYSDFRYGEAGIERALSGWLNDPGRVAPRSWQELVRNRLSVKTGEGRRVVLTLDPAVQRLAAARLGARRGAVVALDARTGAILALVSWPTYDPNLLADDWERLQTDETHPLLARAFQGKYPPGSVFKVLTMAAALDAGTVTPETRFVCRGVKSYGHSRVVCHNRAGHGELTASEAIAKSCNIALAEIALQLGAERLEGVARRAGLISAPAIFRPGTGGASAGRLPSGAAWPPQMLAAVGYGQGETLVTPLGMAGVGQLLAADGVWREPYLVAGVETPAGGPVWRAEPAVGTPAITPAAARETLAMMARAMAPGGTASHLAAPDLRAVGKTGSAENPHGRAHSWFLALAPREAPRVVVVALVENGGAGGRAAGPIAMAVLRAALKG